MSLGEMFTIMPVAPALLVTTGAYHYVSHPIYFASIVYYYALIEGSGHHWTIVIILFVFIQLLRAMRESFILWRSLGDDYLRYLTTTWF